MISVKSWPIVGFGLFLSLASLRAYKYPEYSTDGLSYMANAIAMRGSSIEAIHERVYEDARAGIPSAVFDHLTGQDGSEIAPQRNSFRDRATNAYHFAEYLPCFAIRPIFTELLYVAHYWLGIKLLKALVLIPVLSYWLIGWIALLWMARYIARPHACLISSLLLMSSPILDLARSTTPDSLSCLIVLTALFLLFEQRKLLPGLILLMMSVYVRTDNVVFILLVLAYMFVARFGLRLVQVAVLSSVAILSVLLINHFAGDYGAKLLYYRAFIEAPTAVGEIVPRFGLVDYATALKSGVSGVLHGPHLIFLLLGIIGLLRRPSRALTALVSTAGAYALARLVIFPLSDPRYFGIFFFAMCIAAASSVQSSKIERSGFSEEQKPEEKSFDMRLVATAS